MAHYLEKRSMKLGERRTSVALEPAFWRALEDVARKRGMTLTRLVGEIEAQSDAHCLASAARLFALRNWKPVHGAMIA
jgi:predicted DNA-binding ribbon-helix-helix protein